MDSLNRGEEGDYDSEFTTNKFWVRSIVFNEIAFLRTVIYLISFYSTVKKFAVLHSLVLQEPKIDTLPPQNPSAHFSERALYHCHYGCKSERSVVQMKANVSKL